MGISLKLEERYGLQNEGPKFPGTTVFLLRSKQERR